MRTGILNNGVQKRGPKERANRIKGFLIKYNGKGRNCTRSVQSLNTVTVKAGKQEEA